MDFQKDQATTFKAQQSVNLIARPALGGAWFSLILTGRVTQWGMGATPLFGRLQFNESNPALPWPVFEMRKGFYQAQPFRDNYDDTLNFEGFVSYAQLEAFEKDRNGKDFSVTVRADLRVLNQENGIEDWFIQYGSLHLPAQTWLKVLEQAGYRLYLLQEMRFPAGSDKDMKSAFSHLRLAKDYFENALYEPCLVELRKTFERLTNSRADQRSLKRAEDGFAGERKLMPFEDRMLMIRSAVQSATHKAAHTHDDPDYLRAEAKALLTCTMALVELYPEPDTPVVAEE